MLRDLQKLYGMIDGGTIYALKSRLTSYGVGPGAKLRCYRPLVPNIDDFEIVPPRRHDVAGD